MPPLTHFTLRPSRWLTACLLIIHFGAGTCLLLSLAPWWLKIIGLVICAYSALHAIHRYALLYSDHAVIGCVLEAEGTWRLQYRNGQEYLARLQGDSWRSRYMLLLNFKYLPVASPKISWCRWLSPGAISLVVCADALAQQTFRRLQAHLTLLDANGFA